PRAPRRSGNLRVPAGPPVTPMCTLLSGIRLCLVHPSAARTTFERPSNLHCLGGARFSLPIRAKLGLLLFALAATPAFAQQPQQRDLKVERLDTVPAAKPLQIPVSYAVIVGIARYRNLADKEQLQFAERDAQSIFTALISPEGGNFRVENVHLLTGDKATLANVRREIGTWLPSVAKPDDRVLIYFAGHGFMFQGKGYLAPFDFQRDRTAE